LSLYSHIVSVSINWSLNHSLFHLRIRFGVLDNDKYQTEVMFDLFVLIHISFNIYLKSQETRIYANRHNMRIQRQNISSYLLRAYYSSINKIVSFINRSSYRSDQWWKPDPENAEKHIYLEHMKMYQVHLDTGENRASEIFVLVFVLIVIIIGLPGEVLFYDSRFP
jgi:hypothetical protein